MPTENRIVQAGPIAHTVRTAAGETLRPPAEWSLLPPGDAALTKKVKAMGPTWLVQVKKGRKLFSQGIYADSSNIETARRQLAELRATTAYQRGRASDLLRRARKQENYTADFYRETLRFLAFHPQYQSFAEKLAWAVTTLSVAIGSGTVARTERIPLAERVEAAVIAWLRHQTTDYDRRVVARVKGRRREIRRTLARQSVALLASYRQGQAAEDCILREVLVNLPLADQTAEISADQAE